MRPRFRLKTKLVLAISGMVTAVVVAFATIFIFQLVHQRLSDTFENGDFVAPHIYDATRQSLEMDLSSTRVDMQDPQAVRDAYEEILQTDPGLNSLLQSIVGYSKPIYDVAVADAQGRALLHTDPNVSLKHQVLRARQDFRQVANGGFRRQLEVVYGPPQLYEIRVPLQRGGLPFGSVRVGISTIFLRSELRPQLDRALLLAGTAIFITLLLAAALSNLALRPLAIIGRRLDLMTEPGGEAETEAQREQEPDEVNAVTTKINRLGRQMRDVKEVFTALKDNLDQIMANLQDGLILFTRDARAILVSAAVERFLGIPRQQMLGHNAGEFFTHETQIGRLVLDAFMDHQPLSPRDIETEDGRRIQIALDFIEEGGERIGALLTLRDAESVRRIESEIELSHRLAAIGRLASGVGHEVKNPINAIVVHLEVLRQKFQQMDPDTRRHMDVIAPEIRDKVFNLYFTTKKAGTGIGLAMTYKVMQLHHGSVDFAPASPRGTVFQLTLPLQEQPAEAAREFATHDSATV